jgi:uncharacterized protein YodC (DUF2158 family)
METTFKVGDRVTRPEDVYRKSKVKHGTVTLVYTEASHLGWVDCELYEVQWDNGVVERGFFAHGLEHERNSAHRWSFQ